MMNDFTKEELISIHEACHYWYEGLETRLIDKIQDMIDKYCEHEWENICCQCTLDNIYCHKCQRTLL